MEREEKPHRYRSAQFVKSVRELDQMPQHSGREVAFAGRSNSGKSSALNVITERKALARISKTPGRTQHINFFQLDSGDFLVDLPGYGYAKVPVGLQRHWEQLLPRYCEGRKALRGLILMMDVRHPLTELDEQMITWCAHRGLPAHVLLTKSDKLSRGAALTCLRRVSKALASPEHEVSVQLFSARSRLGVDQVWEVLDRWLDS